MVRAAGADHDREAVAVSEERIRIELVRSGGFAGISQRASVDTDKLPPEEAASVAKLVRAVDFDALAGLASGSPGAADRFQYDLDVQQGRGHHHLTLGERSVPPELRALIDHLMKRYG
jgi:hypothetical protein